MPKYTRTEECEAMQWIPDFRISDGLVTRAATIVGWVIDNGGEARYPSRPHDCIAAPGPHIAVRTINGWAYAAPGHYIVKGEEFTYDPEGWAGGTRLREFTVCAPETWDQKKWVMGD